MALNGGDGHDPVVRIPKVSTGLLGLNLPGALHQHARDDLETVGDPMLHLLQKNRFLAKEIIFLPSFSACDRDIGYRQQEPNLIRIPIFEFAGV